jgi:hypothetical protein
MKIVVIGGTGLIERPSGNAAESSPLGGFSKSGKSVPPLCRQRLDTEGRLFELKACTAAFARKLLACARLPLSASCCFT